MRNLGGFPKSHVVIQPSKEKKIIIPFKYYQLNTHHNREWYFYHDASYLTIMGFVGVVCKVTMNAK